MFILFLGLLMFLGAHSLHIVANGWRERTIANHGERTFKMLYSVVSLLGMILIVWGYGQSRLNPVVIWNPPLAMNHIAALLVLIAFIILAAGFIPGTRIKAAVGHPMVLSVKIWAFAHLLANGRAGDMLLFGAFLIWAVVDYVISRRRDRQQARGAAQVAPGIARDAMAVVSGGLMWLVFALWLHVRLIGVSPFGL